MNLVPLVLAAMGVGVLCFSGCKKEAEPSANSPAVYMKDAEFRKQLADKRKELQTIVNEREPLVKRMEELVKSNHADAAVLEKLPEWKDLHAKVVALNAKFEETRKSQLEIVRKRLVPVNEVSK